jgi:hypothetical protein
MKNAKNFAIPIVVTTVGIGWLLTTLGIAESINWIWSLGLAVVGILCLAGGFDKFSVVVGPLFLVASLFSVLRQTGRLNIDTEVPILVIVLGILMGIARLPIVPQPAWILKAEDLPADRAG